jgi:hypothetical protein
MARIEPPTAFLDGMAAGALVQAVAAANEGDIGKQNLGRPRTARTSSPTLPEQIQAKFDALKMIKLTEMAGFFRRGVSALTLCTPEFPARARIAWVDNRAWFDFADEVDDDRPIETAVIFLARDEFGDALDMIAWSPKSGRIGSWLSRATVLGGENLWSPRIANDGAMPVYESPLAWLRGGRDGFLLVDRVGAAAILREAGALHAESVDLGIKLLELVSVKRPRITAPKHAPEIDHG